VIGDVTAAVRLGHLHPRHPKLLVRGDEMPPGTPAPADRDHRRLVLHQEQEHRRGLGSAAGLDHLPLEVLLE
jgi:hypothetical protein